MDPVKLEVPSVELLANCTLGVLVDAVANPGDPGDTREDVDKRVSVETRLKEPRRSKRIPTCGEARNFNPPPITPTTPSSMDVRSVTLSASFTA